MINLGRVVLSIFSKLILGQKVVDKTIDEQLTVEFDKQSSKHGRIDIYHSLYVFNCVPYKALL